MKQNAKIAKQFLYSPYKKISFAGKNIWTNHVHTRHTLWQKYGNRCETFKDVYQTEVKPLIYTEIYRSCRLISTRNFVCRQFVWKLSAENFCKNLVWKLSAENFCRNLVWKTCKLPTAFSVYKKNLCRL